MTREEVYHAYSKLTMDIARSSGAGQEEIILRPVSSAALGKVDTSVASWQQDLADSIENTGSALYKIESMFDETNALAVSICLHDRETLEYFLQYTTCDQVAVWGYRQTWGAVHLATDPSAHIKYLGYGIDAVPKVRETLDILKQHNADFNYEPITSLYSNPPLALGDTRGVPVISSTEQDIIRKELITRGANPFVTGSSHCSTLNYSALKQLIQSNQHDDNKLMLQYVSSILVNNKSILSIDRQKEIIARKLQDSDIFTIHNDQYLIEQYTKQELASVMGVERIRATADIINLIYDYTNSSGENYELNVDINYPILDRIESSDEDDNSETLTLERPSLQQIDNTDDTNLPVLIDMLKNKYSVTLGILRDDTGFVNVSMHQDVEVNCIGCNESTFNYIEEIE